MSYAGYPLEDMEYDLVGMSQLIDAYNVATDPAAVTWGRLAKIGEEFGEVIAAHIGATNQNPRKGQTHTAEDVKKELLDVALTALTAYEHVDGHTGRSMHALRDHVAKIHRRLARPTLSYETDFAARLDDQL